MSLASIGASDRVTDGGSVVYSGRVSGYQQAAFVDDIKAKLNQWYRQWFMLSQSQPLVIAEVAFNQQLFGVSEITINGEQRVAQGQHWCGYLPHHYGQSFGLWTLAQSHDHRSASDEPTDIEVLSQGASSADQPLLAHINNGMCAALSEALALADEPPTPLSGGSTETHEAADSVFGYVARITVTIADLTLELLFDSHYLHRWGNGQGEPQAQKLTGPVVSVSKLVAQQPVTLAVRLVSQPITVKQLLELKPGHVIPLTQRIERPILCETADPNLTLAGFLVKQAGQKALYLTGLK